MKIEELKKLRITNRANKVIYSLLGLVIGEYETKIKGSNPKEADLVKIMKKLIDSNKEIMAYSSVANPVLVEENEFLQKLLPKQLTLEEIIRIMKKYKPESLSQAMKILSSDYKGRYDGKEAKTIVEDYLRGVKDE